MTRRFRLLAAFGLVAGGGGFVLLSVAPQLLWGFFLAALALGVLVFGLAGLWLPPALSMICPACGDEGLLSLKDGRVGKYCPACGYERIDGDDRHGPSA